MVTTIIRRGLSERFARPSQDAFALMWHAHLHIRHGLEAAAHPTEIVQRMPEVLGHDLRRAFAVAFGYQLAHSAVRFRRCFAIGVFVAWPGRERQNAQGV